MYQQIFKKISAHAIVIYFNSLSLSSFLFIVLKEKITCIYNDLALYLFKSVMSKIISGQNFVLYKIFKKKKVYNRSQICVAIYKEKSYLMENKFNFYIFIIKKIHFFRDRSEQSSTLTQVKSH